MALNDFFFVEILFLLQSWDCEGDPLRPGDAEFGWDDVSTDFAPCVGRGARGQLRVVAQMDAGRCFGLFTETLGCEVRPSPTGKVLDLQLVQSAHFYDGWPAQCHQGLGCQFTHGKAGFCLAALLGSASSQNHSESRARTTKCKCTTITNEHISAHCQFRQSSQAVDTASKMNR